jgi:hypothetical protein
MIFALGRGCPRRCPRTTAATQGRVHCRRLPLDLEEIHVVVVNDAPTRPGYGGGVRRAPGSRPVALARHRKAGPHQSWRGFQRRPPEVRISGNVGAAPPSGPLPEAAPWAPSMDPASLNADATLTSHHIAPVCCLTFRNRFADMRRMLPSVNLDHSSVGFSARPSPPFRWRSPFQPPPTSNLLCMIS